MTTQAEKALDALSDLIKMANASEFHEDVVRDRGNTVRAALRAPTVNDELLEALQHIANAVDSEAWVVESPEVCGDREGGDCWPEHKEWLYYAKQAIAKAEAAKGGV